MAHHLPGRCSEEMSDRSFARYEAALRLLHEFDIDAVGFIKKATRPNGSFNVSRFYIMAVFAVVAAENAARAKVLGS